MIACKLFEKCEVLTGQSINKNISETDQSSEEDTYKGHETNYGCTWTVWADCFLYTLSARIVTINAVAWIYSLKQGRIYKMLPNGFR